MIDKFGKVPTFRGYEFVGEYPYYGQTLKLATLQGPKRAMASDCFDLTYVPEPTVLEETFYLSTFQRGRYDLLRLLLRHAQDLRGGEQWWRPFSSGLQRNSMETETTLQSNVTRDEFMDEVLEQKYDAIIAGLESGVDSRLYVHARKLDPDTYVIMVGNNLYARIEFGGDTG